MEQEMKLHMQQQGESQDPEHDQQIFRHHSNDKHLTNHQGRVLLFRRNSRNDFSQMTEIQRPSFVPPRILNNKKINTFSMQIFHLFLLCMHNYNL